MNSLAYLYRPLVLPISLLVALITLFVSAYQIMNDQHLAQHQQLQTKMRQVDLLYAEIVSTQQKVELANSYYARYQGLLARGLIGETLRIEWIDRLMESLQHYDIHKAMLNFSAREDITPTEVKHLMIDNRVVKQEVLSLEGRFQHELDVIHFLDDLKHRINPLALLESCELKSLQDPLTNRQAVYHYLPEDGNISAKCQVRLLSVAPKINPAAHAVGKP